MIILLPGVGLLWEANHCPCEVIHTILPLILLWVPVVQFPAHERRMEKIKEPEIMKAMWYSRQSKWILILILPLTSCVIYIIRWATALYLCQHFNSQIKDLDFRSTQVLIENIPGGLPSLRKTHSLFHLRFQREDRPSISHSLSWPPVVYVLKVLYFIDRASPPELDSYYHARIQVFLIHEWVRWVQTFYEPYFLLP